MLDFLKEYKEVIVSGLAVILTIVCMLIKRKPKTLEDFNFVVHECLSVVPTIVAYVEGDFPHGSGTLKKSKVINSILEMISSKMGRKLDNTETEYAINKIDFVIEKTLEAPQKKGVSKC